MTDRQLMNRLNKRDDILREIDELKAKVDALNAEIKDYMGERETMEQGRYHIFWKWRTRRSFNGTAFQKDHADLYEQYSKEITDRPFTVKTVKGGVA